MCEVCMLMRTLLLTATATRTSTTMATMLLLPLRALLLLLPLRALLLLLLSLRTLLLLAEGRVGTLALDRTELGSVCTLLAMSSLALFPMEGDGLADVL